MISQKKIKNFQEKILAWYEKNKRDLPWRKTTNPYEILVSEIMLQQTQVDRVIPFYHRFLASFPDLESLAKAEKHSLLEHWSGLGYNSRVLRLQKLAQQVKELPQEKEALENLPGIGPYTSSAILAFAFNKPFPVIDTNIRRVLLHEFQLSVETPQTELQDLALQCIPRGKSRIWHNALMDFGALQATSKKTGIESLSKQSAFKGSTRWVRGQIVKTLLKERKISIYAFKKDLKEKYSSQTIDRIMQKMEKDDIIKREGNQIALAE